ncbi:MAG: helix-hairpin-helix domain-containing protein [Bacteroidota bacterium]
MRAGLYFCRIAKLTVLLLCSWLSAAQAPVDSLPPLRPEPDADLIEDFIQNNEDENGFDFNTVFEALEGFRSSPLNLNKAGAEELKELLLLTDLQINNLLAHRQNHGKLISIYELQSISGFDLSTIKRLLPYVRVDGGLDDLRLSVGQMFSEGSNELFLRWFRVLEEERGFKRDNFLGDRNRYYVRYKHRYANRLSVGFTAEKDPGEEFFKGSNQQGFDYYSAHLYLRDYNSWLKSLAVGDFTASFGQGLLLYSGFGYGKSPRTMDIKRTRRAILPYSSVNENNYFRGLATTIQITPKIEVTAFASFNRRDGNIVQLDTLDNEEQVSSFTSLQQTGLHRTEAEIEDKNAVTSSSYGASIKYKTDAWHIAWNNIHHHFRQPFEFTPQAYNRFFFKGNNNFSSSVDYSFLYRNYNFFGETAISDNGSIAAVHGLIMSMSQRMNLALLHRHFPKDYQSLAANPFAETTGARNETGFYVGLEYLPSNRWRLNAYADVYRHPWLRFNADAPSRGYEYRIRLTYFRKRQMESWLEFRTETKQINRPNNESRLNTLADFRLTQFRWHLSQKVSKSIELRTRVHGGFDNGITGETLKGILVYQDIVFKPLRFPLSFTSRFALFDTDGFNVRFYTYENDLTYTFSVPAYFDQGSRFYINVRYKGIRKLTIEARYARSYWPNLEQIGSGNNLIEGNGRSTVSGQVIWRF